jgi:hypothetical protein
MPKQSPMKLWVIREWYNYGWWNRYIRKTSYFEATSRKDALAQYHAQCTPKFPRFATIKASTF